MKIYVDRWDDLIFLIDNECYWLRLIKEKYLHHNNMNSMSTDPEQL